MNQKPREKIAGSNYSENGSYNLDLKPLKIKVT